MQHDLNRHKNVFYYDIIIALLFKLWKFSIRFCQDLYKSDNSLVSKNAIVLVVFLTSDLFIVIVGKLDQPGF